LLLVFAGAEMIASDKSLTYFYQNVQFVIPYFQRRYVWTEENWQQLWDGLTSTDSTCYLGTFIIKNVTDLQTKEYGKLDYAMSVIDGQQRLTTISLLMRAVIDKFQKAGENTSDYERLIYFVKENRDGKAFNPENWCKLIQPRSDYKQYKEIIWGKKFNEEDIESIIDDERKDGYSNIEHCYKFFTNKLKSASEKEMDALINYLHSDHLKTIVVIELNEKDDEQIIFDTVNSAGVPLTISEIIKNALFQDLDPDLAETVFNSTWKTEFELDEKRISDWTAMKGTGQNARAYIDSFLFCYAAIKGFYNPTEKQSRLANLYKNYISQHRNQGKVIVEDIVSYAEVYRQYFVNSADEFSYSDGKLRLYKILAEAKVSAFDPYVLQLLYDNKSVDAEPKLNYYLRLLENYFMRHFAVQTVHRKSFNADCQKMLKKEFDFEDALSDPSVNNEAVRSALCGSIPNARAKLILYWIELYRQSKDESADNNAAKFEYKPFELEHIMPQEWHDNWDPIKDSEGIDVTRKYINQLGNMTLLKSKLNKKLGNKSFKDKLNGSLIDGKQEPGIIKLSSLSITKEFTSKESWTGTDISERSKKFSDEFCEIWPTSVNKP